MGNITRTDTATLKQSPIREADSYDTQPASGSLWDATDQGARDRWVKLPAGPVSPGGGQLAGDFESAGIWKQT